MWYKLRSQQGNKVAIEKESRKEIDRLIKLRQISLTEPLAEKTRPASFADIIGQNDGIKALRAAICCPNPQHGIIYEPPGVGKTAAARLVLAGPLGMAGVPQPKFGAVTKAHGGILFIDEIGVLDVDPYGWRRCQA
ncbi:MAG: Lon protease 2 [Firmicutes bacterium]|nr:Lon protease 2 [Bacillota bacterium]